MNILILGNGFDLAHNLKTGYMDFLHIIKNWNVFCNEYNMAKIADENLAELILTSGGTGFSLRDCMPEATLSITERIVPGIPEAMRAYSMQFTKRAMLTRAAAGIRKSTLIVNLPGSPKAVRECLEYIIDDLGHGIEILTGEASNCARK